MYSPQLSSLSTKRDAASLGLTDVFVFFRRYSVLITTFIGLFLILGTIYLMNTPQRFVASAQVVIEPRRGGSGSGGVDNGLAQYNLDASQLESQIQIIKSEQIAKLVVSGLGLARDPELVVFVTPLSTRLLRPFLSLLPSAEPARERGEDENQRVDYDMPAILALSDRIQVRRIGQSYVLEISYTSTDRAKAARITNSVTAAYIRDRLQAKIDQAQSGGEILEQRISNLQEQRDAADRAIRSGMFGSGAFPTADARVITTASPPSSQNWPRPSLVLALSTLLGLFLGVLCGVIHRSLDLSIHNENDLDALPDAAYLGSVPKLSSSRWGLISREVSVHSSDALARSLYEIKTSLHLQTLGRPSGVIGVTSTAPGEGKSTIATNLCRLFEASGTRALLIRGVLSSDLVEKMLVYDMQAVVQGDFAPDLEFIPGTGKSPDVLKITHSAASRGFRELFDNKSVVELWKKLGRYYGLIVFDLPDLASSVDARLASMYIDYTIYIIECNGKSADAITKSFMKLRQDTNQRIGIVLNKSSAK